MDANQILTARVDELWRWKERIDELQPAVMAFELRETRKEVAGLKRALYTFALGVVGSSIIFAFTVFALLGKH
jgi:hypothetical protein